MSGLAATSMDVNAGKYPVRSWPTAPRDPREWVGASEGE